MVWKKRNKPPFPNNARVFPAYTLLLCQLRHRTGSDGEKTWRKAVVFPVASLTESAFKSHEDESSGKPNKAKHTHKRTT